MSNKKKTPEFDIADDTPTTSDGECTLYYIRKTRSVNVQYMVKSSMIRNFINGSKKVFQWKGLS